MSDHDPAHGHDHDQVGHLVPYRVLVATGLGLLFLTWITVAVAGIDLGELNIYVALAIAVLKATLVGLFFMHLRWDRQFNAIVFVGAVAFVGLFLALAMTDSAEYAPDVPWEDAPSVIKAIDEDAARQAAAGDQDH